jgi:hypothetical protein
MERKRSVILHDGRTRYPRTSLHCAKCGSVTYHTSSADDDLSCSTCNNVVNMTDGHVGYYNKSLYMDFHRIYVEHGKVKVKFYFHIYWYDFKNEKLRSKADSCHLTYNLKTGKLYYLKRYGKSWKVRSLVYSDHINLGNMNDYLLYILRQHDVIQEFADTIFNELGLYPKIKCEKISGTIICSLLNFPVLRHFDFVFDDLELLRPVANGLRNTDSTKDVINLFAGHKVGRKLRKAATSSDRFLHVVCAALRLFEGNNDLALKWIRENCGRGTSSSRMFEAKYALLDLLTLPPPAKILAKHTRLIPNKEYWYKMLETCRLGLATDTLRMLHDLTPAQIEEVDKTKSMLVLHDELAELIRARGGKNLSLKVSPGQRRKFNHVIKSEDGDIEFYVAEDTRTLRIIGRELKNCVSSYAESALKQHCSIVYAKQNNRYISCIEVRKSVVSQAVGFANSHPDKELDQIISRWARKANLRYTGKHTFM